MGGKGIRRGGEGRKTGTHLADQHLILFVIGLFNGILILSHVFFIFIVFLILFSSFLILFLFRFYLTVLNLKTLCMFDVRETYKHIVVLVVIAVVIIKKKT